MRITDRYKFKDEETLRLVLRTHTTAVSTWALHRLAENPRPARYFSIDRVFRNETVDATHLAEFHQIEGVIADFGLTLGGLQRFLGDFFANMGLSDLRFKPAYNPYTEARSPSPTHLHHANNRTSPVWRSSATTRV
jgi:phenylalanyl-tRNA synthetase alpha chain